jgi:3'-5' exoribonuclease
MLLKHIMLSHHGEYEFGSPKRPKIQEAIIINYLDDLAAKINNFQSTLKKEGVAEGAWTNYSKMHDRYLYHARSLASSGPMDGPEVNEDKRHPVKKAVLDVKADASGKLPLDI